MREQIEQQWGESESVIAALKDDCVRMQQEVEKALKMHKITKQLQDRNHLLQQQLDEAKS